MTYSKSCIAISTLSYSWPSSKAWMCDSSIDLFTYEPKQLLFWYMYLDNWLIFTNSWLYLKKFVPDNMLYILLFHEFCYLYKLSITVDLDIGEHRLSFTVDLYRRAPDVIYSRFIYRNMWAPAVIYSRFRNRRAPDVIYSRFICMLVPAVIYSRFRYRKAPAVTYSKFR